MRRLTAVAVLGSMLMAAGSWSVGAVPVRWQPVDRPLCEVVYYVGLTALAGSWLLIGRWVLDGPAALVTARQLRRFAVASAAPFLLAAPLGRDLWAYAAQGHLTGRGLDPYAVGPAAAPGSFAAEVSTRWQHIPAPYGPVWLRLSQAAAWAAHGHPTAAALLLRLPAFLGLVACAWAVTELGRRTAADQRRALWLGVANPMMVVLGVGGGHNDLAMLGLALAGLAVAARSGRAALVAGAALATVAALIKSPAAVIVAFTVPLWLAGRGPTGSRRRTGAAVALAAGTSAVTAVALTLASGLGFGWTVQVNSDAHWVSWLSLPSGLAMAGKWLAGSPRPNGLDDVVRTCRTVGEVVAVLLLLGLWWQATRTAPGRRPRRVLALLTVALGAAALLAPSVQPWYYLWAIAVAGLVAGRRTTMALAVVPVCFVAMNTGSGYGFESSWPAAIVVVGAGVLTVAALRRPGYRPVPAPAQSRTAAL